MNVKSFLFSLGYSGILVAYVALFTLLPLLQGYEISEHIIRILFAMALAFSLSSVANHPVVLAIALFLALPHFIVDWGFNFDNSRMAQIIKFASLAGFYSYVIFFFGRNIFSARVVNANTILGAVCVYLFIGTIWAALYTLVEYISPGSFAGLRPIYATSTEAIQIESQFLDLLYYSYITLTTLGYGNVYPSSHIANSLSSAEAIVGQLYLTVLIARLIAQYKVGDKFAMLERKNISKN